jgi:hypothetical protein
MNSAPPSHPQTSFNPASLPAFSAILVPYRFGGSPYLVSKIFVVLGHRNGFAICLKATSNVELYKNNPEKLAGCVFYKGGEISLFREDTAIQPDNQVPIPHAHIADMHQKMALKLLGSLPADFVTKLILAIENSTTLDDREKERIMEILQRP